MKSLAPIAKAYQVVDAYLAHEEERVLPNAKARWTNVRTINDQAYFVVIFAQLEAHVNEQWEKLVRRKRTAPWPRRRLWENIDLKQLERISFKDKVALLINKETDAYKKIIQYSAIRNRLAHGELSSTSPVAIDSVIVEIGHLARQLRAQS